ncbi:MAG: hypothetical protein HY662_03170 [Chloroflexi bacterium]|nr:hypothetical protein [Chloroflexota bacterium]
MDNEAVERVTAENNLGIDALRKGKRDQASTHFAAALDIIEGIGDPRQKRQKLSTSAPT